MELKNTTNHIRLLALSTLVIVFLSPLAQAEIGIGAIVIDSQIEGKGDFGTNDAINVGDIITTGPKGNVTILFDDESMLTLGPNAKAQIVKYSGTPAPGVSEIKIISGSFRYFPGIILENGGKQVLNNLGGTSTTDNNNSSSNLDVSINTEQPLADDFNTLNEQLTDISSLLNEANASIDFQATNVGSTVIDGGVAGVAQPGGDGGSVGPAAD